MANNRIQLTIAGVSIVVSTPEDDSYVERIAETVNNDMQTLLTQTKASVTSAALLLSVDYLDRFQKANRSATNMRTQIKGYLADAANAKLLFDDEKKRSDFLARENEDLKSKVEQLSKVASSVVATPKGEDVAPLKQKIQAQAEYIAAQDAEIKRLQNEQSEHLSRVGTQSEQISELEHSVQQKQSEVDRLLGELKTLEEMISEDIVKTEAATATLPPAPSKAQPPKENSGDYDALPPLYRPDPVSDATYDIDDMPNLNWTDNI